MTSNVLHLSFSSCFNPSLNGFKSIILPLFSNPKRITKRKEKNAEIRAPDATGGVETTLKYVLQMQLEVLRQGKRGKQIKRIFTDLVGYLTKMFYICFTPAINVLHLWTFVKANG